MGPKRVKFRQNFLKKFKFGGKEKISEPINYFKNMLYLGKIIPGIDCAWWLSQKKSLRGSKWSKYANFDKKLKKN